MSCNSIVLLVFVLDSWLMVYLIHMISNFFKDAGVMYMIGS